MKVRVRTVLVICADLSRPVCRVEVWDLDVGTVKVTDNGDDITKVVGYGRYASGAPICTGGS